MNGPRSKSFQLQQIVRNPDCNACTLHKSSVNVCVMGKGLPSALLMLLGEAPGKTEAETGKPFMGRAGRLLDEILDELQLKDTCYISNMVKCRPPDNRTPTEEEVKTCTSLYLFKELSIVKPYVILLMGRTAIDFFFQPPMTFKRGVVYKSSLVYMVPTWHPSFVLRTQSKKWPSRQELKEHITIANEQAQILLAKSSPRLGKFGGEVSSLITTMKT